MLAFEPSPAYLSCTSFSHTLLSLHVLGACGQGQGFLQLLCARACVGRSADISALSTEPSPCARWLSEVCMGSLRSSHSSSGRIITALHFTDVQLRQREGKVAQFESREFTHTVQFQSPQQYMLLLRLHPPLLLPVPVLLPSLCEHGLLTVHSCLFSVSPPCPEMLKKSWAIFRTCATIDRVTVKPEFWTQGPNS
jgi:hypothetical protein